MATEMTDRDTLEGTEGAKITTHNGVVSSKSKTKTKIESESCFDKLDHYDWQLGCKCAKTVLDEGYDDDDDDENNKGCCYVCMISIIVWTVALGLGVGFLNDSELTLTSTAMVISIRDDVTCGCDDHGCDGEQFVYGWRVTNSSTNCINAEFKSGDVCYRKKDDQRENQKYFIGDNSTWYHDDGCEDWSQLTPKQNYQTGVIAMIVFAVSFLLYAVSVLFLRKCHLWWIVCSFDFSLQCVGCCFNRCCCRNSRHNPLC